MFRDYITITITFIFFNFYSAAIHSQIVLLDTIRTTTEGIGWPRFCDENFAWYEAVGVVQRYNGVYDTLLVDPMHDHCNVRSGLYVTDNDVLWGYDSSFDPVTGMSDHTCQHTFTWEASNGGIVMEDEFGILSVRNTDKNVMFVRKNNSNFIFDIDAETFTPFNDISTTNANYVIENSPRIVGDKMWANTSKYDLISNQYLGWAIILITISTGMVEEVYSSSNQLGFAHTDYPDQLAFTERLPDGTRDIYYYSDNALYFVSSINISSMTTFNEGVVYREQDSDELIYWKTDGTLTVLHPDANLLAQSDCFLAYHYSDFSNFPFVQTELFITNGTNTESFSFIGSLSSQEFELEGNEFLAVFNYRVSNPDVDRLIKGRHNLSCPDICPDDDAFAEEWNSVNFLYTKTMESIATIPGAVQTRYEASDWILLSENFEVMSGALFEAEIVACP